MMEQIGFTADERSDSERFAQTGTGWVLRELSLAEPERAVEFVEMFIQHFSNEGVRYAIALTHRSRDFLIAPLVRD